MLSPEASRAYIVSYSSTWSQSLRGKQKQKQNTKQLANQRTTKNIFFKKKKEARKK